MRLTFGPDDEEAAAAARAALTEQFGDWLLRRGLVVPDASDADLFLDWKWAYGDGDYLTWRRSDVDELLLEHVPRKLSASPAEAASIPHSLGAFVEFLAHEALLSERSDPADEIARRAVAQRRAFEDAMADPSRFGMAKRLFEFAGIGADDVVDQSALDEAMERFNSLSFEERGRILGLSHQSPPDDQLPLLPLRAVPLASELVALASNVPMLAAVDRLCVALGDAGIRLTKTGNPSVSDGRRLADAVGVDADIGDVRSSADLPELFAIARVAQLVGAIEIEGSRLRASPSWAAREVVAQWRDVVTAVLEAGASTLHFGSYTPMPMQLAGLADDLAFHFLAILWIDGGTVPMDLFVGALEDAAQLDLSKTLPRMPAGVDVAEIAGRRVGEVFESLVAVGVVEVVDGTARLTTAAPAVASDALRDFGFDARSPEDLRALPARSVIDEFMERDDDPAVVMSIWADARDDAKAAAELVDALLERPEPARVLCGFSLIQQLGDAAHGPVEAAVDSVIGPQAWLHLVGAGRVEVDDVPREVMVDAGVNLFAAMSELGSPADVIEPLLGGVPAHDHPRFIDELAASAHPRTGELLELLGRHHPERIVAKHARKAAHRWRSAHG